MPTLELLFIIIISLLVVAVVLSVVDWIYLASLSSQTALLEREVEKKSIEFDTYKKDRAGARQPSMSSAAVIESSEPLGGEEPAQPQQSIEDTIQIVRNVRGNFERTEHFTHAISEYPPASPPDTSSAPHAAHGPAPSPAPVAITASAASDTGTPPPQARPDGATAMPPDHDRIVRTAGAPGPSSGAVARKNGPYVLKLYSESKRDADFQVLWQAITRVFQACPQPQIVVDLTGINFMYDKEMDYLEKIKYLLAGRGGSFSFINCDRELLTLFGNRPQLSSIIQ